jgi:hypothetical protein
MTVDRRLGAFLTIAVSTFTAISLGAIGGAAPINAGRAPDVRDRIFLHLKPAEVVAGGQVFGAAGAYVRVTGTVDLWLDPLSPRNATITDLDKAPRNASGLVEISSDIYLLRPADLSRWNQQLIFEVNNRGNKVILNSLDEAPWINDPQSPTDFGDGMLMKQGYAIAWAGWEGDVLPGNQRLTVRIPIAHGPGGEPITQRISVEFHDRYLAAVGETRCLPLSGSADFASYPVANGTAEQAELRVRPSDTSTSQSADLPPGIVVPRDLWSFAGSTTLCLRDGFTKGNVYELSYIAQDPRVMGVGYAVTRDVVAFLRQRSRDDKGVTNPLGLVRHAIAFGSSSSAMYLRDFIYQGFNEDLAGRRVFDGVFIAGAGAQKLSLNYRFAQPNPFSTQHADRFLPALTFPFNFGVRENPMVRLGLTGGPLQDGILKRASSDPLVIQVDTSTEYRQFQASLVDTDGLGHDVTLPWNARHYLVAGVEHGGMIFNAAVLSVCQQPMNPTYAGPALRALFTALAAWVSTGQQPPPSRRPTVANGLLTSPAQAALDFPQLTAVRDAGAFNPAGQPELGAGSRENGGVLASWHSRVVAPYRVLLPAVDALGIDEGGVTVPAIGVPTATATGWNIRQASASGSELCDLHGMWLPLPVRGAPDDPRPSLLELYGSHDGYVRAVEQFSSAMARGGWLLPGDAAAAVRDAAASHVLTF